MLSFQPDDLPASMGIHFFYSATKGDRQIALKIIEKIQQMKKEDMDVFLQAIANCLELVNTKVHEIQQVGEFFDVLLDAFKNPSIEFKENKS